LTGKDFTRKVRPSPFNLSPFLTSIADRPGSNSPVAKFRECLGGPSEKITDGQPMLAPTLRESQQNPRVVRSARDRRWRLTIVGAMSISLLLALGSAVRADDDDDNEDIPAAPGKQVAAKNETPDSPVADAATKPSNGQTNDGVGIDGMIGGSFGQGVSQDKSLLPVELFPYFMLDNSLYFSEMRFFPTIDGTFGGNLGAGYRYYAPRIDRIFGASVWYDADGTRDEYFQQIGVSLETYGKWLDFRTNGYFPVGQTTQQSSSAVVSGSAQYVGENLAYSQLNTYMSAMTGLDMEVGVQIPGHFAEEHGIHLYGGWYYYGDEQGDHILGASARVQANIAYGLDASVQVTNDNYFDTRAFVGVSWTFGPLHRSNLSQDNAKGRIGQPVTRNYTVLAVQESQTQSGLFAIDPATDKPYVIAHVDSGAAAGGNGGVNSPFQTIAAAETAGVGANIIFVHAGSVLNGSASTAVLSPGQMLFGDGAGEQHFIAVSGLGSILMPHGPTSGDLPVLNSASGVAVTMASNTTLAGFTIAGSTGAGILANGAANVLIKDVTVNNSGSDGVQIVNATGSTLFNNVSINNSAGNGLLVNGGTSYLQYIGSISGSQGHDVLVENVGVGGHMDLSQALFPGSGSQGILLDNVSGVVNFNNLLVSNTAGPGVAIEGGSGNFQFGGQTIISGAGAQSVLIENVGPTAAVENNNNNVEQVQNTQVTFNNLSIANRHDAGLVINNVAAPVTVNGTTTITNEGGTSPSAINIENSSANVTFKNTVNVTNTTVNPGISLTNNTGTTTFTTLQASSVNGTALYANNGGTLVVNSAQTVGLGGTIKATNGTAVDLENTTMNVNLYAVDATGGTVGLKLVNSPGSFAVFGASDETAGSGGVIQGAQTGILLQNTGNVGLVSMILNGNGVGISSTNTNYLAITNVQISNSSSYGISASDTKTLMVTNSAFSANGATNINAQVDTVGSYSYSVVGSTLTSATGDNLDISTLSGGTGATVNVIVAGNSFTNQLAGSSAINVNWAGTVSGSISQNAFVVSGGSNTGVLVNNASTTGVTTLAYTNNVFTSEGGNDTALHVITAGAAQLNIASNEIQFGAQSGTGFRFSVGASSNVNVTGNSIIDTTDGATGIIFDSITAPSTASISGNTITLSDNGGLLTQGIVFTSVTDQTTSNVTTLLNLGGTQNNTIQGADTPFYVPTGTTSGQISINGTLMP
jgi:Right handed beta helix region